MTDDPLAFQDSTPDSGYSIDNLAPGLPQGLSYTPPGILSWNEQEEEDFAYFTVYGSDQSAFDSTAVLLENVVFPSADVSGHYFRMFHVSATDFAGNEGQAAHLQEYVAIEDHGVVPHAFALRGNRPNPFRSMTTIAFDLPEDTEVILDIFDVRGRRMAAVIAEPMVAGRHHIPWSRLDDSGRQLPPGVYFYRLRAGSFTATRKLTVLN